MKKQVEWQQELDRIYLKKVINNIMRMSIIIKKSKCTFQKPFSKYQPTEQEQNYETGFIFISQFNRFIKRCFSVFNDKRYQRLIFDQIFKQKKQNKVSKRKRHQYIQTFSKCGLVFFITQDIISHFIIISFKSQILLKTISWKMILFLKNQFFELVTVNTNRYYHQKECKIDSMVEGLELRIIKFIYLGIKIIVYYDLE
ncbi:unnamed protein product [Paramecium octaurelia]|uniref:Uncharacterized protein n=1 Tax=Paramecium octaurelia TaxID=43137 RepID=A0A8S1VJU7_PAROT|nr:unnamed protein product [Paramecium octaurelia]